MTGKWRLNHVLLLSGELTLPCLGIMFIVLVQPRRSFNGDQKKGHVTARHLHVLLIQIYSYHSWVPLEHNNNTLQIYCKPWA
jgi:hypothetical protein